MGEETKLEQCSVTCKTHVVKQMSYSIIYFIITNATESNTALTTAERGSVLNVIIL